MSNREATVITTDEEIDASLERSKLVPPRPRALTGEYNHTVNLVILKIDNGQRLVTPREQIQGLEDATEGQLADIQIFAGQDIAWPQLAVDHYLPRLLEGNYATDEWKQAHQRQTAA